MSANVMMTGLNPNALHGYENGKEIYIEDVSDSDGRLYRIEYRCATDGTNANAWCLYNPWGDNPFTYDHSHLSAEGLLCVGPEVSQDASPYDLDFVVRRSRTWCDAYSFLREHGYAETCRVMPEWGGRGALTRIFS